MLYKSFHSGPFGGNKWGAVLDLASAECRPLATMRKRAPLPVLGDSMSDRGGSVWTSTKSCFPLASHLASFLSWYFIWPPSPSLSCKLWKFLISNQSKGGFVDSRSLPAGLSEHSSTGHETHAFPLSFPLHSPSSHHNAQGALAAQFFLFISGHFCCHLDAL